MQQKPFLDMPQVCSERASLSNMLHHVDSCCKFKKMCLYLHFVAIAGLNLDWMGVKICVSYGALAHLFQLLLCIPKAAELTDCSLPQPVQPVGFLLRPHYFVSHLLLQVLFLLSHITLLLLGLLQSEFMNDWIS